MIPIPFLAHPFGPFPKLEKTDKTSRIQSSDGSPYHWVKFPKPKLTERMSDIFVSSELNHETRVDSSALSEQGSEAGAGQERLNMHALAKSAADTPAKSCVPFRSDRTIITKLVGHVEKMWREGSLDTQA
jgi:hypothetical protein